MLGIVLAPYGQVPGAYPYGIAYSYGGNGTFMCPDDPYQNQRGEPGFYTDTQLGLLVHSPPVGLFKRIATMFKSRRQLSGVSEYDVRQQTVQSLRTLKPALKGLGSSIPSDMALAPSYGYLPHMTGWVDSKQGMVQNPWIPPNEWRPAPLSGLGCAGCAGPQMRGLGDATVTPVDPQVATVLQAMNDHNQKIFTLTVITTVAVAVSAIVATVRNSAALKKEQKLLKRELEART